MAHRVLLISGGKYHDFARGSEILCTALTNSRIEVTATTDPTAVSRLPGNFNCVVLYTQGDILDDTAIESLTKFVRNGGGLVAVHSANASIKSDALAKL